MEQYSDSSDSSSNDSVKLILVTGGVMSGVGKGYFQILFNKKYFLGIF